MPKPLDFETQLHCVPVRNAGVRASVSDRDPGALIVEVRLRYGGLLGVAARLVRARRARRYELAGIARELYEALDGKRTLEDFIDELSARDKLTFFEARALLVQYLKDLMQRGLVVIAGEKGSGPDPRQSPRTAPGLVSQQR
jgi:hypothetical protein